MAALCPLTLSYCQGDLCHREVVLLGIENSENGKAGSLGSRRTFLIWLSISQEFDFSYCGQLWYFLTQGFLEASPDLVFHGSSCWD